MLNIPAIVNHGGLDYQSTWGDYGSVYESPKVMTKGKTVLIRGMVTSGKALSPGTYVITILPVGLRPNKRLIFACSAFETDRVSRVDVLENGQIIVTLSNSVSSSYWISLDLSFEIGG